MLWRWAKSVPYRQGQTLESRLSPHKSRRSRSSKSSTSSGSAAAFARSAHCTSFSASRVFSLTSGCVRWRYFSLQLFSLAQTTLTSHRTGVKSILTKCWVRLSAALSGCCYQTSSSITSRRTWAYGGCHKSLAGRSFRATTLCLVHFTAATCFRAHTWSSSMWSWTMSSQSG